MKEIFRLRKLLDNGKFFSKQKAASGRYPDAAAT